MRVRATAVCVLVPLLLGACTSGTEQQPSTPDDQGALFVSDVDVDTPELRRLKNRADIEPCVPGDSSEPESGRSLPSVTLPCLGGGPEVTLDELRGPLVINLWAQWCGPCRAELPFYQRLHEEADRVDVLGIDYQDTQPGAALLLAQETGVTYPLLADPNGKVREPFRVRGLPGVVLVDEGGHITHLEYVVIESYDQLRSLVEQHLGVDVP